jgi:hypothetical protein
MINTYYSDVNANFVLSIKAFIYFNGQGLPNFLKLSIYFTNCDDYHCYAASFSYYYLYDFINNYFIIHFNCNNCNYYSSSYSGYFLRD